MLCYFLALDVVFFPPLRVGEVGLEVFEEDLVEEDLAAFEALPGAVRGRRADAVVYVAEGDGLAVFVVEDGLEGGDDLHGFVLSIFGG